MNYKKKYKKLLKIHDRFQESNRDMSYRAQMLEIENERLIAENKRLNKLLTDKAVLN